jgi:hypothetical protein
MCAGSFTSIFQPALALGILSRRQVYTEAVAYEQDCNGNFPAFLTQFNAKQARAAATVAECGDYHVGLAHRLAYAPTQVCPVGSELPCPLVADIPLAFPYDTHLALCSQHPSPSLAANFTD